MSAIKKRNITNLPTGYEPPKESNAISTSRRRKLLFRRLTVFFALVAAISYVMISTLLSQSAALGEMNKKKSELKQDLQQLKKQETILEEEIVKLNDDEYIAKLARKEFFLSEKNEIIFNLPEDKKEKSSDKSPY